jgi:hypothetical protein
MSITIRPFDQHKHLDAASELLAARHERDRERDPRLPAPFALAPACRAVIEPTFASDGWRGVVAESGGSPHGGHSPRYVRDGRRRERASGRAAGA